MQLQSEDFFPTLQENALLGDFRSKNVPGEHAPGPPLEVRAFGPQFYKVPAYSQASAFLLQKLMKTLKTYFFLAPEVQWALKVYRVCSIHVSFKCFEPCPYLVCHVTTIENV